MELAAKGDRKGFNSRTREGATGYTREWPRHLYSFNSRTREGATYYGCCADNAICVSIHAPVRVRQEILNSLRNGIMFQFTHP